MMQVFGGYKQLKPLDQGSHNAVIRSAFVPNQESQKFTAPDLFIKWDVQGHLVGQKFLLSRGSIDRNTKDQAMFSKLMDVLFGDPAKQIRSDELDMLTGKRAKVFVACYTMEDKKTGQSRSGFYVSDVLGKSEATATPAQKPAQQPAQQQGQQPSSDDPFDDVPW